VSLRANLLEATSLLDDVALDKYSFIRDAYLQRRQNLIYEGNPPDEDVDGDGDDDDGVYYAPSEDEPASAVPASPSSPASSAPAGPAAAPSAPAAPALPASR